MINKKLIKASLKYNAMSVDELKEEIKKRLFIFVAIYITFPLSPYYLFLFYGLIKLVSL